MTTGVLAKLAWLEVKLFLREPVTAIFAFAFPLIFLFVLAEVFGNEPETDAAGQEIYRGVGATDYYVPAYVALVIAALGLISLPVHLAAYRERGVLRRFRASGVPVAALFGAHVAVMIALAAIGGLLITGAAALVYDVELPASVLGVVGAFLLATLAFASLGLLLGGVLPTARAAQGIGFVLFFVMLMISGAGPPPEVLSEPLLRVADALPLTHAIVLVQDPWLGFAWTTSAVLAVCGFMLVSAALAARFFRWR
jgi:ABC-2 type transport system permease protein